VHGSHRARPLADRGHDPLQRAAANIADREHPDVTWSPRKVSRRPAKGVRARCLVRGDCLAWALEQPATLASIWAGTSNRDRRMPRPAPAA
jgi:hypothetical protein